MKWVETKDWRQAFEAAVPKRKFKDAASANDADELVENAPGGDVVVVNAAALEEDVIFEGDNEPIPTVEQEPSKAEAAIIDPDVLTAGNPTSQVEEVVVPP